MDRLIFRRERMWNFVKERGMAVCSMLALLLLVVTACQSNSAGSATEAMPQTQPATATPVPPTATSVPPTVTPDRVQRNVKYLDSDDPSMPLSLQHVVDIYLPEAGGAPYPTMVMLTGRAYRPVQYSSLAQQFVERGYAVVVVGYRISPAPETYRAAGIADVSCAFAWLMTHTATYGLDPQRVFVLGHDTGGFIAVISSLYDTASWKDTMTGCPYPLPDRAAVKGVITYDAFLGIPEGTLGAWPMDYAVDWNIPESEMSPTVKTLRAVPPQEWRTSELLDDNARKLATMLPLYWAYQARDAQAALPPYLLIYSGDTCYGDWGCGFFDWATEAEAMARAMRTAGVAATAQLLPNENASHRDLVKSNSGVPAQVAEAVDVFIRELSK